MKIGEVPISGWIQRETMQGPTRCSVMMGNGGPLWARAGHESSVISKLARQHERAAREELNSRLVGDLI